MRFALISVALLSAAASLPVMAQSNEVELRVNKLEREMRAVQRRATLDTDRLRCLSRHSRHCSFSSHLRPPPVPGGSEAGKREAEF